MRGKKSSDVKYKGLFDYRRSGLKNLFFTSVGSSIGHIMGRGLLAGDPLSALVRWQIHVMHNERDAVIRELYARMYTSRHHSETVSAGQHNCVG